MTLTEILANEELRRTEFPVAREKVFLAHAAVCALPRRVAEAVADCARQGSLGDQEAFMLHRLDDARKLASQLLNCQTDEVALVGPTSRGSSRSRRVISSAATGSNIRPSANICANVEFYFASMPSRRSARFRPWWNMWISSPPTRTNGCSARAARACCMSGASCRKN
jgi:selenocysteine lyase/cysteine desulfurase